MIKNGVILYGIKPEMVLCYGIAESIFNEMGFGCVITSAIGKEHMDKSLHPVGYALDLRTKHIDADTIKLQIVEEIKKALPQCDVILESLGEDQEHIHFEMDPKDDKLFQNHKRIYKETGVWPA